ncbi:hypothetical protein BH10PSE8_BH10PSE8_18710 [soil metagenome]
MLAVEGRLPQPACASTTGHFSMRIAVLADIHANREATEAVL